MYMYKNIFFAVCMIMTPWLSGMDGVAQGKDLPSFFSKDAQIAQFESQVIAYAIAHEAQMREHMGEKPLSMNDKYSYQGYYSDELNWKTYRKEKKCMFHVKTHITPTNNVDFYNFLDARLGHKASASQRTGCLLVARDAGSIDTLETGIYVDGLMSGTIFVEILIKSYKNKERNKKNQAYLAQLFEQKKS